MSAATILQIFMLQTFACRTHLFFYFFRKLWLHLPIKKNCWWKSENDNNFAHNLQLKMQREFFFWMLTPSVSCLSLSLCHHLPPTPSLPPPPPAPSPPFPPEFIDLKEGGGGKSSNQRSHNWRRICIFLYSNNLRCTLVWLSKKDISTRMLLLLSAQLKLNVFKSTCVSQTVSVAALDDISLATEWRQCNRSVARAVFQAPLPIIYIHLHLFLFMVLLLAMVANRFQPIWTGLAAAAAASQCSDDQNDQSSPPLPLSPTKLLNLHNWIFS